MPILLYASIAFKIWMAVDGVRRRAHPAWLLLVLFVPFGEWIYFVLVKLRDFNVRPAPAPGTPALVDLDRLRRIVKESPSFENRATLGRALLHEEQHAEAAEVFELALGTHADDKEGLLGLGLAYRGLGRHKEAIDALSRLLDQSFGYADYLAAESLAEALSDAGQAEDAVALGRQLARHSHRPEHRVLLARLLVGSAARADAGPLLSELLTELEGQPDYIRRRRRALEDEARALLETLQSRPG